MIGTSALAECHLDGVKPLQQLGCSIFTHEGCRTARVELLKGKGCVGRGSTLYSTEDSGLGTAWILDIISGMTLDSSLAIDLAMIEAIFLLELEPFLEPERRLTDFYKVE